MNQFDRIAWYANVPEWNLGPQPAWHTYSSNTTTPLDTTWGQIAKPRFRPSGLPVARKCRPYGLDIQQRRNFE